MSTFDPKQFSYSFLEGPLETRENLFSHWTIGNCRRAIQWYYATAHQRFLEPNEVLLPQAYKQTGRFLIQPSETFNWELLAEGDLIYADKRSRKVPLNLEDDNQLIKLHTAIYIGDNTIWHATAVSGESCTWTTQQFLKYYIPIAAKRVVSTE